MAFVLNLPNLSDIIDIYPMKIYDSNNKSLPCSIVRLDDNADYVIPKQPIDKGSLISEHIFNTPASLSLVVFVKQNDLNLFEARVKQTQLSDKFFRVVGANDQNYNNMKIVNISKSENADMIGAYHINIYMEEVILVNSIDNIIDTGKVKNPSYGGSNNIGEVNPKKLNENNISNLKKASQSLLRLVS